MNGSGVFPSPEAVASLQETQPDADPLMLHFDDNEKLPSSMDQTITHIFGANRDIDGNEIHGEGNMPIGDVVVTLPVITALMDSPLTPEPKTDEEMTKEKEKEKEKEKKKEKEKEKGEEEDQEVPEDLADCLIIRRFFINSKCDKLSAVPFFVSILPEDYMKLPKNCGNLRKGTTALSEDSGVTLSRSFSSPSGTITSPFFDPRPSGKHGNDTTGILQKMLHKKRNPPAFPRFPNGRADGGRTKFDEKSGTTKFATPSGRPKKVSAAAAAPPVVIKHDEETISDVGLLRTLRSDPSGAPNHRAVAFHLPHLLAFYSCVYHHHHHKKTGKHDSSAPCYDYIMRFLRRQHIKIINRGTRFVCCSIFSGEPVDTSGNTSNDPYSLDYTAALLRGFSPYFFSNEPPADTDGEEEGGSSSSNNSSNSNSSGGGKDVNFSPPPTSKAKPPAEEVHKVIGKRHEVLTLIDYPLLMQLIEVMDEKISQEEQRECFFGHCFIDLIKYITSPLQDTGSYSKHYGIWKNPGKFASADNCQVPQTSDTFKTITAFKNYFGYTSILDCYTVPQKTPAITSSSSSSTTSMPTPPEVPESTSSSMNTPRVPDRPNISTAVGGSGPKEKTRQGTSRKKGATPPDTIKSPRVDQPPKTRHTEPASATTTANVVPLPSSESTPEVDRGKHEQQDAPLHSSVPSHSSPYPYPPGHLPYFSATADYRDLIRRCLDLDMAYKSTTHVNPTSSPLYTDSPCMKCRNCPCRWANHNEFSSRKRKAVATEERQKDEKTPEEGKRERPSKKKRKKGETRAEGNVHD